jgi:hypothetical protein
MAHAISKPLDHKRRFWFKHIRRWQQANITQSQYCKKHDLSFATFRWWRGRFLNEDDHQTLHEESSIQASPHFTEVALPIKTEPEVTAYDYEIALPNQIQLRLRHNCDPKVVSALLSVLEAGC